MPGRARAGKAPVECHGDGAFATSRWEHVTDDWAAIHIARVVFVVADLVFVDVVAGSLTLAVHADLTISAGSVGATLGAGPTVGLGAVVGEVESLSVADPLAIIVGNVAGRIGLTLASFADFAQITLYVGAGIVGTIAETVGVAALGVTIIVGDVQADLASVTLSTGDTTTDFSALIIDHDLAVIDLNMGAARAAGVVVDVPSGVADRRQVPRTITDLAGTIFTDFVVAALAVGCTADGVLAAVAFETVITDAGTVAALTVVSTVDVLAGIDALTVCVAPFAVGAFIVTSAAVRPTIADRWRAARREYRSRQV